MTGRANNLSLRPVRVIAGLLIIAGLFWAREILIPAALALLLSFLLLPPIRALKRVRFPHLAAVLVVVLGFTGLVAGIGVLVGEQMVDLSLKIPDYRHNLREKVRNLRASEDGPLARLSGTIQELKQELTTRPSTQTSTNQAALDAATPPLRVEVVNDGPTIASVAGAIVGPLMVPAIGVATTWLLLLFILIHADDLRSRMASYAGMRRISLTTAAANEIGEYVGRFVRMQIIINFSYGVMLAIGLLAFGVPQAFLWGVIGFVLRFAPYVGPWTAAALPSLLAIAVFPGWSMPLGVIATIVVIEGLSNLVLEPWLYGSATGISSLGVVVATVFWAWVWGPVGLLLAVPMTVCLTGLGKYVPQFSLLNIFFGQNVALSKSERLYQDLLVGDSTAADRMLDEELTHRSLPQVCDEILTPILVELKRDLSAGVVERAHGRQAMRMLESVLTAATPTPSRRVNGNTRVVCLSGQSDVDACAARLLAICCRARGVGMEVLSPQLLVNESLDAIREMDLSHAAIVQVIPTSVPHARRLIKALLLQLPEDVTLSHLSVGSHDSANLGDDLDGQRIHCETSFESIVAPLAERESIQPSTAT